MTKGCNLPGDNHDNDVDHDDDHDDNHGGDVDDKKGHDGDDNDVDHDTIMMTIMVAMLTMNRVMMVMKIAPF